MDPPDHRDRPHRRHGFLRGQRVHAGEPRSCRPRGAPGARRDDARPGHQRAEAHLDPSLQRAVGDHPHHAADRLHPRAGVQHLSAAGVHRHPSAARGRAAGGHSRVDRHRDAAVDDHRRTGAEESRPGDSAAGCQGGPAVPARVHRRFQTLRATAQQFGQRAAARLRHRAERGTQFGPHRRRVAQPAAPVGERGRARPRHGHAAGPHAGVLGSHRSRCHDPATAAGQHRPLGECRRGGRTRAHEPDSRDSR